MRKPEYSPDWPPSFKTVFDYDSREIFGDGSVPHYTMMYQNRFQLVMDLVSRHVPANARILDLAAAQGNYTLELAERGYNVTWNDIRGELADYVRSKYEKGTVSYLAGNIFEVEPMEFDAVLLLECMEHAAHPDDMLRKVEGLVKPGGVLIVTTPNGAYLINKQPRFSECTNPEMYESIQFQPDSDGHIFLLHSDEIHHFASSAGLQVVEEMCFGNPLTCGHVKLRYLHGIIPASVIRASETWLRAKLASVPRVARFIHYGMAFVLRKK
jgi:2-polyprenyl-3-methyl-5-hydroxy-6-metoxy-1,4-benzoquinol methylase